jgi:ABC-type cobalamin/Fe3+-siderophores transport system ATPase subunit
MGQAIAHLENATVTTGGRTILGPLSLSIHQGDFLGVIGPNGAGKSTLLETLAGIRPLAGGNRVIPMPPRAAVGILFQHHDYLPDLPFTVAEVVSFGRTGRTWLFRRLSQADRESVDKAIGRMELGEVRSRPYRELSGGMRQRVHLARLLAQEARLFLLDEPTSGLDLAIQERLIGFVGALAGGADEAAVMVTHEIDHLPPRCNRVVLLKRGKQLADGTPAQVLRADMLSELFDCRMGVENHGGRYHAFRLGPEALP